jgi:hypothetical protein
MKYIITENKYKRVIKKYIESTYGDIEMVVDNDDVIQFFSEKVINGEGHRKRIAYRSSYNRLWVDFTFLENMIGLFGTSVGESIKTYFKDTFGIEIDAIRVEF